MVAYFCHHLSDNYIDLSDLLYVVLSDLYVDLLDLYVDLSDLYVDLSLIHLLRINFINVFLPSYVIHKTTKLSDDINWARTRFF